jgi:hypothetical protein
MLRLFLAGELRPTALFPDFSLVSLRLSGLPLYTALNRTGVGSRLKAWCITFFVSGVLLFPPSSKPLDLVAASNLIQCRFADGADEHYTGLQYRGFLAGQAWTGVSMPPVREPFDSILYRPGPGGSAGEAAKVLLIAVLIGVCVPMISAQHRAAVYGRARPAVTFAELVRNPLILTATGLIANLLGFTLPAWLEPQ